jgi:hypothetical protein
MERLNVALARLETAQLTAYSGADIGIDTEQFAYFALSVLWRAAVYRWQLPDGNIGSEIQLSHYEEPIRKYLLGEASFPHDIVVILTVCSDPVSRSCLFSPSLHGGMPVRSYSFLTLGIFFDILTGRDLPDNSRQLCCTNSKQKWIFKRDCNDRTFQAFAHLASTSKPAPNLLRPKVILGPD